jgi:hypothetical protein
MWSSSKVKKPLSQRQHNCPQCNLSIGRDLNAAINIKNRAKALLKDLLPAPKFEGYEGVQLTSYQLLAHTRFSFFSLG